MDLYVELYGRGNEIYFKHFDQNSDPQDLVDTHKDDYAELDPDVTEGILSVDDAMILIEYDDEEIYDGPLKDSNVTIQSIAKEEAPSLTDFSDGNDNSVTLYWGHDGMVNFSIRGEIDEFEPSSIQVYTSNPPKADNFPGSEIIVSLECEEAFIDEEDNWFDPKMGYWGPMAGN